MGALVVALVVGGLSTKYSKLYVGLIQGNSHAVGFRVVGAGVSGFLVTGGKYAGGGVSGGIFFLATAGVGLL